jgi:hypothetical protein
MPRKRNNKRRSKKKARASGAAVRTNGIAAVNGAPRPPPQPKAPAQKQSKAKLHKEICAITDPFCDHAKGVRFPDGTSTGTLAMQIRTVLTLGTGTTANGAQGRSVFVFGGQLPYAYNFSATIAGGPPAVYTWSAAYLDATTGTSFTSYAAKYRIVSWGIVLRSIVNATVAAGYITVRRYNDMPAVATTIAPGSMSGTEVKTFPLTAGMQVCVSGEKMGVDADRFQTVNTTTTENPGWGCIVVEQVGTATTDSATPMTVEVYYNVELTIKEDQPGLNQFLPPATPKNVAAITGQTKVANKVSTIIEGGVQTATKYIEDAAAEVIDEGWAFLSSVGAGLFA